jgi:Ca2+/Na+ antiporter
MIHRRQRLRVRFASALLLCLVFLFTTQPVWAEAGKGLSRISMGEVLWGLFLVAVGLPLVFGLLVFALLSMLATKYKGSMGWCVCLSVVTWLLCLGLMMLNGEYRTIGHEFLMSAVVTIAAAVMGYYIGGSNLSTPEQEKPFS